MTQRVDILVIGSGAAGLATAVTAAHLGASVLVVEKHDRIGGTSAWSGGWLWIPRNPLAVEAGIVEDIDAPLTYLTSEIGNRVNDRRIQAYLETGPEMVRFMRDQGFVNWIAGNTIPDFHDSKGAANGGRSICAAPFDGRKLGKWAGKLRQPLDVASVWGMGVAAGADMGHFFNAKTSLKSALHVTKRLGRHVGDLIRFGRGTQLVNGNALVGQLLKAALDLGVEIRLSAPAQDLIVRNNRVFGAVIGGEHIHARNAVVLATGGFPHDMARIRSRFDFVKDTLTHHSAAPPENTGDGLRLASNAGAEISTDLTEPAAWAPVSLVPQKNRVAHFPHLVDRAKPGFIMVGPDGKRFVNEANSYHDVMQALFRKHPQTPHAWIIADAQSVNRFGIGAVKPWPFPKARFQANGYLKRGRTIAEIAHMLDLPNEVLQLTIQQFNQHAKQGHDPDFNRGASPYNRIQGDAKHSPNPSLGVLEKGPFYAVKLVAGSLGTFEGIKTNVDAQALDAQGNPIQGLFAVGNDAASIFGGNYPSGGITLGPAMTFGYIAAQAILRNVKGKK